MSQTVKVAGLQAGMKMAEPILGKKGDIKVHKGEILSQMHVAKLNKWVGVDEANPRGIEIESAPLHTGQLMPGVVDKPWESPLVKQKAKENMQSKTTVSVDIKDGKVLHEETVEDDKPTETVTLKRKYKRKRA